MIYEAKTLVFTLSIQDQELQKEITLAGLIATKLSKGEYTEDPVMAELQAAYESCHQVNAMLHRKLNRVRTALDHEEVELQDEVD